MPTMFIMRGLPGSGKSTLARMMATGLSSHKHVVVVSADDYFMRDGVYEFDPTKIALAHGQCQQRAKGACADGVTVIVDNTNTQRWEMEPYIALARTYGYDLQVITVETSLSASDLAWRCSHGVPVETIQRMRDNWESNWQAGNPLPPWERPRD